MVAQKLTAEERQKAILEELHIRGRMTHNQVWKFGHEQGFYTGGDGGVTLDDLNALVRHNQARRNDGFWRHIGEPDSVRLRYPIWSDYWTPKGGR